MKLINPKTQTLLPTVFQPGMYDVLIGRGKKIYDHVGNKYFLKIIASKMNEYLSTSSKSEKTKILVSIISEMKTKSDSGAGFLRKNAKTGLWFPVGEALAREKVSQAFRDALHDNYRSSNSSRKRARKSKTTNKHVTKKMKTTMSTTSSNKNISYRKIKSPATVSQKPIEILSSSSLSRRIALEKKSEINYQRQQKQNNNNNNITLDALDEYLLQQIYSSSSCVGESNLDKSFFDMEIHENYDFDSNNTASLLSFDNKMFDNEESNYCNGFDIHYLLKEELFPDIVNIPNEFKKNQNDDKGTIGSSLDLVLSSSLACNTSAAKTA